MLNFESDVNTLNDSAFYPGCGDDFDLIWNPPTGDQIENWVLCDWGAWVKNKGLIDACGENLEKVFKNKNINKIKRSENYTTIFCKSFRDFELFDGPSYIKQNGYENLKRQKKVLFYEVENSEGKKKNIWLFLGYEGLALYRSIYCDSHGKCELYVRKFGVGTKDSQGEEFTRETSGYLVDLFKTKAPTLLADIFIVGLWLDSIPPFAQIAVGLLSFTSKPKLYNPKLSNDVEWVIYSKIGG